ncbi:MULTISPECIES: hypothetical protein [Pseudomonas]|nr:hypothetical protein [Pseudomonas asiatica]MEB6588645.1 hypothetical protein [Pseudomonas asiatica]
MNARIIRLLSPPSPSATDVLLSSSAALFFALSTPFYGGLVTQKCG